MTSDIGDWREIPGRAGFLVAPGDAETLAEGILTVLRDEGRAKAMAEAALEVRERYYWEVLVLPFARGTFDNVFAFDIIEHIQDDAAFLNSLFDVLSEDGIIWLSTPSDRFKIFPSFLTNRAHRGWGHVRAGYSAKELQERMPPGVEVTFRYWNEPVFRASYLLLRLLDRASPALANRAAELCARLDNMFSKGLSSHIFAEVR